MRALGLALLAISLTLVAACGQATATSDTSHLSVLGFQSQEDATSLIARSPGVRSVGVDASMLTTSGITEISPAARAQLRAAHKLGLTAQLLVGNYSDAIADFDEPLAHRMLSSPARIRTAAHQLAADVRAGGWDGVSVDLESLTSRDTAGLTTFLGAVRRRLPAGATLTICLQADTSAADYAANGYDLAAIAKVVDVVELMTYDEHGPWERQPGPVGELSWTRAAVKALTAVVPAGHVDLGVAGYGYAWRPKRIDTLSDHQARKLAGHRARWKPSVGEWTAKLADGSVLWWSDARSYRTRVCLAAELGLHGLAVWSLGLSDPLVAPSSVTC